MPAQLKRQIISHCWLRSSFNKSLPSLFVFRQRFDQVIEAQPKTPTVVEEDDREEKRDDKQYRQHLLVIDARDCEEEKARHKDDELSRDHVCQDCPDKESLFALEQ